MRFQTANLQLDLLDTYFSMVEAKGAEQPGCRIDNLAVAQCITGNQGN